MEKSRDMKRVPPSQLKRSIVHQSGSERSKKDKIRRVGVVGRVTLNNKDSDMSIGGSDCEDELRPTTCISKRIKFPKKHFDDCDTVDHASVPRKRRSAMKKRSCKSISPPWPSSKKLKNTVNGVQLVRKDGMKRSKLNMEQGDSAVGPITKDEAEVVETLYALAGMFQDTDKSDEPKLDGNASEAKLSVLHKKGSVLTEEEEPKSAGEAVKVESLNEASLPTSPNISRLPGELDNYVAEGNLPTMSNFSRSGPTTETSSCNAVIVSVPPQLEVGSWIKQPEFEGTPIRGREAAIACQPVTTLGRQHELQYNMKECKNSVGSALWPGLSPTGRLAAGTQGASLQSSTAKPPAWLGNATCATRPYSSDNVPTTEKGAKVSVDGKKSWKGCCAHVYISRLVQVLQTTERGDGVPMQPTHVIPNEGLNQGALIAANKLYMGQNCSNGAVSNKSLVCSAAENNPNEVRNAILLHKRLLQDQTQEASTWRLYTPQKQTIDFLSLSAQGCGLEANNNTNKVEKGLGTLTQFDVPYQQPFAETFPIVPFSMSPRHYSSAAFSGHLSAAAAQQVHRQLPPYFGSRFCSLPPHLGTTASPPKQQQQQQHQWIPTAQLAAEYKLGGVAAPCIPNWQNKGRESPSSIQYAQAILPPSHSSIEFRGHKYVPILPQQHQVIAINNTSLPPAKLKVQQHHLLPHGYEGNGGGFHRDKAPPLQLLCNKHI